MTETKPTLWASVCPKYEELRAYLRDLAPMDYVIVGSACLAVRGLRDVRDLDVLIKPELWPKVRALAAEGFWPTTGDFAKRLQLALTLPEGALMDFEDDQPAYEGEGRTLLRTGCFDFMTTVPRIQGSTPKVFEDATFFDGQLVVSLRHCLAIKALANRNKDYADMKTLAHLIEKEETDAEAF